MIKINLTRDDELECASVAFRRTFETPDKVDQSFEKLKDVKAILIKQNKRYL